MSPTFVYPSGRRKSRYQVYADSLVERDREAGDTRHGENAGPAEVLHQVRTQALVDRAAHEAGQRTHAAEAAAREARQMAVRQATSLPKVPNARTAAPADATRTGTPPRRSGGK